MAKRARKALAQPAPYPNLTASNADELERTLRHLHAALFVVSGGGAENFGEMHPDSRDAYLCMCCDLAGEAQRRAAAMLDG